jgi:hypothetical protein
LFQTESIVLDAIDWKAAGDATVVDVSILHPCSDTAKHH